MYLYLCIFSSISLRQTCYPDDVSGLHSTRPSRWCQLVHLLRPALSHLFWGQNSQDLQLAGFFGAALLASVGTWLQHPLLLFQRLRAIPGLVFHRCNRPDLVNGHRGHGGCPGASWSQSGEDLCHFFWLSPPGLWCIWWYYGTVGFSLQTAAQVNKLHRYEMSEASMFIDQMILIPCTDHICEGLDQSVTPRW